MNEERNERMASTDTEKSSVRGFKETEERDG